MIVYLDNSSTTKQYEFVTAEMLKYMTSDYGNPSSLHRMGLTAEKAVRSARKSVASAFASSENEIIFTSGGTEADNMALFGTVSAHKRRGNKIITSKVEHQAVLESCKHLESMGIEVVYIDVDDKGRVDMDALKSSICEKTILISIMQVNNETGTIMPIEEISKIKGKALLHTDAVQSLGKISLTGLPADLISVSGHKIHGPKGIGALYIQKRTTINPILFGGGQEGQLRSGTENVAAIAGFGKATEAAVQYREERVKKLSQVRNYLREGIRAELRDVRFNSVETDSISGESGCCSPGILNVSFLGTRGEVILHGLENEGIYVSTGSACASNKKGESHVLAAMGLSDKEIESALRFSFSEENTVEEIDYVLCKVKTQVEKYRKLGSFR